MMVQLIAVMFAVGMILGLVGAGGSGFIISILTVGFGFSIHTSFGTAVISMIFSSLAGTFSHYREGNIVFKSGIVAGGIGAAGAWAGSMLSHGIPSYELKWMTAGMLFLSGAALWLRMIMVSRGKLADAEMLTASRKREWIGSCGVGVISGGLSGLFGIGATPFIQLGLMSVLGMPVRLAAGTTMLVIIPIAIGGGMGYYQLGDVEGWLLLQVTASLMLGSYLGAKFTKRIPIPYLKTAIVMLPMTGGSILLF
ncbi:sulfite exporter TauE/SafE family protein [Paenibacillus montanisoli]|uniref:Probable membrane transporter protein n=1 Tax=Paenibacillus montanisoli TaxID=2081970 RepID=A0A328U6X8_9BACL|nr:sulfite exporter TauE/SafE family protein [Paenibacillus montanisoli]RAP75834.1 sulfite exporter TauE/SafE family protein [Paenibacillus montanisoli]